MKSIAYLPSRPFAGRCRLDNEGAYGLELVKSAAERLDGGASVEVLTFGNASSRQPLTPRTWQRVLPVPPGLAGLTSTISWELPSAIAEADLVHLEAANTRSFELALLVARQMGKPTCVSIPGGHVFSGPRLSDSFEWLDLADCLICPSHAVAAQLTSSRPIHVIHGGVAGDWLARPIQPPRRDCLVCLGKWTSERDIEPVVSELSREVSLVVCGRADTRGLFRRLVSTFSRGSANFLASPTSEQLCDLYRSAVGVVYPAFSSIEQPAGETPAALSGFGLLEAMACGAPVICPPVGSLSELVRDGQTGFLVDSMAQLIDMARLVATTPGFPERMGQNAHRDAARKFSAAAGGAALHAIYRRLLGLDEPGVARNVA